MLYITKENWGTTTVPCQTSCMNVASFSRIALLYHHFMVPSLSVHQFRSIASQCRSDASQFRFMASLCCSITPLYRSITLVERWYYEGPKMLTKCDGTLA